MHGSLGERGLDRSGNGGIAEIFLNAMCAILVIVSDNFRQVSSPCWDQWAADCHRIGGAPRIQPCMHASGPAGSADEQPVIYRIHPERAAGGDQMRHVYGSIQTREQ